MVYMNVAIVACVWYVYAYVWVFSMIPVCAYEVYVCARDLYDLYARVVFVCMKCMCALGM